MKNIPNKSFHWQFTDDVGSFRVESPDFTNRLYFPLANEGGILSSITPDLHGDIKTSHNSFLMQPVAVESLHNSKTSRNFWVYVDKKGAWSLTGVSAAQSAEKFTRPEKEKVTLHAGMLWHRMTRENRDLGLKAEITNFAPVGHETVEIMTVQLTNTGASKVRVTPTAAVPIFARSADNLRDHSHVTSLLQRIIAHSAGVVVRPTMSFDERGHKLNELFYFVLGTGENGELPAGSFPTVPDFIGEGGSFEAPQAVVCNLPPSQKDSFSYQGKSTIGAIRFSDVTLAPRQTVRFVLLLGIADHETKIDLWLKKFGSYAKADAALRECKIYWQRKAEAVQFKSQDPVYNNWVRWVCLQPTLRKLFGCSFLPDFDYGRGGRGWRDLWQDCLALLLSSPEDAKSLLLNNFNGIRIDGSNATIIGQAPGEFIADRNNITRVWMDHGVWPYLTLSLYIHQSGDLSVLFENARYFRDRQFSRGQVKDAGWSEEYGQNLKTARGKIIQGTILEHLLVQHLVQFYNVGEHNHIRLENADWNDGLDMAHARGESVAFTSLYGANLKGLAQLLEDASVRLRTKRIVVARELLLLLDRVAGPKVNYDSCKEKQNRLKRYFSAVQPVLSGKQASIPIHKIAADLRQKSDFIFSHVRQKEWIQTHLGEGFFNGYYDNHGRRVEGNFGQGTRMTLAGQVYPIMTGVATPEQVRETFATAKKYLKDKVHGGYRLNTDFHEIRLDLGRAFSFAYGEKENGAFFSHMAVMFANALFQRNFVTEGHDVLNSIYRMCLTAHRSRIFPGVPEYFNNDGRGMYHYLTGSASWFVMTLLTQVFGVRGHYGDLVLAPKFTRDHFGHGTEVSVETYFAGRRVLVTYKNPKKIGYEHYYITQVLVNKKTIKGVILNQKETVVSRAELERSLRNTVNQIVVVLE